MSIEIDRQYRHVRRLGRVIQVDPKPFAVFDLLISNTGKVLTRDQIASAVWGRAHIDPRTIDAMVGRLRKAINGGGALSDPIRTMKGQGYKFNEFFVERDREWPAPRRRKTRLLKP